jgi:hypothetical protein
MRQKASRTTTEHGGRAFRLPGVPLLGLALLAGLPWPGAGVAQQTGSGSSIVEEALKDAEQDQRRDTERVRRMVDEAVKGAEQAPSGQEAVNPTAPDVLRPLPADAPGALPPGTRAEDLVEQPVRDASGARIGTVKGLVRDEASGVAQVMVEFAPVFGQPGKTSVLGIEALTRAEGESGYVVDLTPVAYDALPAYAWQDQVWRRVGA